MITDRLDAALAESGLRTRGAFHPGPGDGLPAGLAAGTVVLVGNVGGDMWRAFRTAVEAGRRAADVHPLDTWTRSVVGPVATAMGAVPLYPFEGPPHHPFQRWAQRAGPLHESPIGLLVDAEAGLWHALRAALVFADRLPIARLPAVPSPCGTCAGQPCLQGCPVGAIRRDAYDVAACVAHVRSPAGSDCLENGCRARRACPVGTAHRYPPEQARFHMVRFLAAHARNAGE